MNMVPWRAWLHPRYDAPEPIRPVSPDRNASAADAEWVRSIVQAYVDSFHAELLGAYRWTNFTASVAVDPSRRTVRVAGHAPVARVVRRFEQGLRSLLAPQWNAVPTMTAGVAHARQRFPIEPVTSVWREWPGAAPQLSLSTEILRHDGPVIPLVETFAGTLIDSGDGTVGWITTPLSERPANQAAGKRRTWADTARSYLGVPYLTGGATMDGIDCSGLVQRIYREAAGRIVPRHTRDQFAVGTRCKEPQEGQLAFLDRPGDLLHVGVVLRNPHCGWSVVHASSTRAAVVEDPLEWYVKQGAVREAR